MKRLIKKAGLLLFGCANVYLCLLIYPKVLFAHQYEYRCFSIYSDRAIPSDIEQVLDDAISRLEFSELYSSDETFNLFLCHEDWRFAFFTRNPNGGGQVNFLISPNVFIRNCDPSKNTIIPPEGWMYDAEERPLSYFIAHESTHVLQRKISSILVLTAPRHILEGYADYIGKRPAFDMKRFFSMYQNGDFRMNPNSGLYHRYHLYLSILMDENNLTFLDVLERGPDLEETLQQMEAGID